MNLDRFLWAQNEHWSQTLAELIIGRKRTHWMWWTFPILTPINGSVNSQYFGLTSIQEAQAYLKHPELSARLEIATRLVWEHLRVSTLEEIFNSPVDARKFLECMKLFASITPKTAIYHQFVPTFWEKVRQYVHRFI